MAMAVQHVHLKGEDPQKTAQFYIDNLGAKLIAEIPGRGCRLDLHGLQLNITGKVASQSREQLYGIEHIAVDTDDGQAQGQRGTRPRGDAAQQQRPPRLLPAGSRWRPGRDHRESLTGHRRPAWR